MRKAKLALVAALATLPAVGRANVIYTENFDTDASGRWTFLSEAPGDTPAHNFGNEADFFFDYSTIGVPAAPRSGGTTRGLKMEANVPGTGRFTGMSASPIGQAFTADYGARRRRRARRRPRRGAGRRDRRPPTPHSRRPIGRVGEPRGFRCTPRPGRFTISPAPEV